MGRRSGLAEHERYDEAMKRSKRATGKRIKTGNR
jgi:hypothetical protein